MNTFCCVWVILFSGFVSASATGHSPLLVLSRDNVAVPFPPHIIKVSTLLQTIATREQQRAARVDTSSSGSLNGDGPLASPFSPLNNESFGIVQTPQGLLLSKTLLTKYCSCQDLRQYKSLVLLALGGMKEEARIRLRQMTSDKAFSMAWIADYICSPMMKKVCTDCLPYHLVASRENLGSLSPDHAFLNYVLHWSMSGPLRRMTKMMVPEAYELLPLPFDGEAAEQVIPVSSKTFLLQTKKTVSVCSWHLGVWTKELLYEVSKAREVLRVLYLGSSKVAVVLYDTEKKKSKFIVFRRVVNKGKTVKKVAKFWVAGKVEQVVYMLNNTFVWNVQEHVFRAQWYEDIKNWIPEPCFSLVQPVKGLASLGADMFGVFSEDEVQIFSYQPLQNHWQCRYNRLFAGGKVYGILPVLDDRIVVCVNRLLVFIQKKHKRPLQEEACLGLPALGAIRMDRMHDLALILMGEKKSAVVLIDSRLSAYIRTFLTEANGIALPFSSTHVLLCIKDKLIIAEPFVGSLYTTASSSLSEPIQGAALLDASNAIVWSSAGKIYQIAPARIKDARVLLAAACMKVHHELKGISMPLSPKGWIAQACASESDGTWLERIVRAGYGVLMAQKEQCGIM